ncbi:MAG TPA: hypothetical protein VFU63_04960 [Ktedonobacterales bacterium]|nr:hypothetical protein [Ktedonobacterales bacterium]
MDLLLLRALLTPSLIALVSVAGRRWGPAASGLLVGLPLTSGPVLLILALQSGTAFAVDAARGIIFGTISVAFFCVAYGWSAVRWRWPGALLVSWLVFLAATALLQLVVLPLILAFALCVVVMALALAIFPHAPANESITLPPPPWDIPARMMIATAFVLLLTGAAPQLGPHLTGLLAPFPVFGTVLGAFTHAQAGTAAVLRLLRGLLVGLLSFASFFLVAGTLIMPAGILPAFVAATITTVTVQGVSQWLFTRRKEPRYA